MSNIPESASARWRLTLAVIEARIVDLKTRSDADYQALHSRLDAQIAELRRDLKALADEVAKTGPDAYIESVTMQLDELKAKGDAAYELLQSMLASKYDGNATSQPS